ncbi:MAG: peptide deformylase [Bacteroidota bacterium]|nr:peptide deformylase [Bacteroidota bacterium]
MRKQLPITTYGMEILRKKTNRVEKVDAKLINLIEDMFYSMDKSSGIGLAAPQINRGISLAVIDISAIVEHKKEKPLVLINPEILDSYGEVSIEEGCLSIPDIREDVTRPKEIFLKYDDFDLKEIKIEIKGFLARVVQHEIDHLNGKLFIDYLSDKKKKEIKKHLSLIRRGKIDTEYPLHVNVKNNSYKM